MDFILVEFFYTLLFLIFIVILFLAIPGFTTSMFYDVRESLGNNWSPNSEVTSDSEMCRLECALQNGQMEEILQSGADDEAPAAPNARREELMHYFHETQVRYFLL